MAESDRADARGVWNVKSTRVTTEVKLRARKAAQRQGMALYDWIAVVVDEAAIRVLKHANAVDEAAAAEPVNLPVRLEDIKSSFESRFESLQAEIRRQAPAPAGPVERSVGRSRSRRR